MAQGDNGRGESFQSAAKQAKSSLLGDILGFLKHNKKWWMLPILVVLLFLGILMLLSGTAAAPFIYTLF